MRIVILMTTLFLLAGCRSAPPPQPVALHPAGSSKSDCHPTQVTATIKDETMPTDKEPWWMTHTAVCPDNMREVSPSLREWNTDHENPYDGERMNWKIKHTYCIPDGM